MNMKLYGMIILLVVLMVGVAQGLVWNATSSLPSPTNGMNLVYYNGYVYCLGGRPVDENVSPNPHATDVCYYAEVNTDGSIGAWITTTPLPAKRANGGAAAYNDRIYYWGGWDEAYATHNECYYAPINPGGSIGSWVTSSVTIPDSIGGQPQMDSMGYGVMIWDKYLYIVNGEDNTGTNSPDIYYCEIQPSGDYGPWLTTTAMSTASWFHGVVIFEGTSANYLYRVAGNYRGTSEVDIFYAPINLNGTVGTWLEATVDVPEGRYEFACTLAMGKIYIIGGLFGATAMDTVYYGGIDPDTGDVFYMTTDAIPYPAATSRFSTVSYQAGDSIYILAVGGLLGYSWSTDPKTDACYYAYVGSTLPPTVADQSRWTLYR